MNSALFNYSEWAQKKKVRLPSEVPSSTSIPLESHLWNRQEPFFEDGDSRIRRRWRPPQQYSRLPSRSLAGIWYQYMLMWKQWNMWNFRIIHGAAKPGVFPKHHQCSICAQSSMIFFQSKVLLGKETFHHFKMLGDFVDPPIGAQDILLWQCLCPHRRWKPGADCNDGVCMQWGSCKLKGKGNPLWPASK